MKKYYSLLLLLILITSVGAQVTTTSDTHPKLLKTQGTGPSANVHCSLQDKSGRLWFGTTGEGVYRYDGNSFKNFTVKDGLNSNHIACIYEDNTGNIWFGTMDGICRYDGKIFSRVPITVSRSKNLLSYDSPRLQKEISVDSYGNPSEENAVWDIIQDRTGRFWFGTTDGIYRYDGKTFTHFSHNDGVINNSGLPINKIERIVEDTSGNIWFGGRTNEGIFRFDRKSITNYKPDGKNWLRPVLKDKTGNIWFSNWLSVYRYEGQSFVNFTKNDGSCFKGSTFMIEDKNGNIWCGNDGENGLCRYDGKSFKNYTMKDGLNNNSVWSIVEDNSGYLWIGTRNTGLSRFDGKTFTTFSE
ncbi:MAG TPA: two-component regulator propeller domain-containing protein [Patescibacteria group bacterium]|nr:two-component regulator propeller domain-containing protein [Patescibacteria group bacterium]